MKRKKSIYEILGVDPNKISEAPYSGKYGNLVDKQNSPLNIDPNAPSGSIFDDYSKYPPDPQNYWTHFRIYTIIGILATVGFIGSMFFDFSSISFSSGRTRPVTSYSHSNDYEEVVADEVEAVEGEPAMVLPNHIYLKGDINYRYGVTMHIDTRSNSGEYYYDRNGNTHNNMSLKVDNIQEDGDVYRIKLSEYNPSGDYCGSWEGIYDGNVFEGNGVYLGKPMPFRLHECASYETGL